MEGSPVKSMGVEGVAVQDIGFLFLDGELVDDGLEFVYAVDAVDVVGVDVFVEGGAAGVVEMSALHIIEISALHT